VSIGISQDEDEDMVDDEDDGEIEVDRGGWGRVR
jgi:hypothetical protein